MSSATARSSQPRLRRAGAPSATAWASATATGITVAFFVGLAATFAWLSRSVLVDLPGFLTTADWHYRGESFGAGAMLYGSLVVATIALLLATPVALGAAVFFSEWLPRRARLVAKSLVELLAGIPSVVYGLVGVLLLRDWVYRLLAPFEPLSGDTLLTAGILLAVMILPTLTTLADDALQGVPAEQRSAGRALGLTRSETLAYLVLPQARAGLAAAVLLALGRALGETIAIYLVIGRLDGQLPESLSSLTPLGEAGQTLTTKLGGPELFLAAGDSRHFASLMGLALILLVVSTLITVGGRRLVAGAVHD